MFNSSQFSFYDTTSDEFLSKQKNPSSSSSIRREASLSPWIFKLLVLLTFVGLVLLGLTGLGVLLQWGVSDTLLSVMTTLSLDEAVLTLAATSVGAFVAQLGSVLWVAAASAGAFYLSLFAAHRFFSDETFAIGLSWPSKYFHGSEIQFRPLQIYETDETDETDETKGVERPKTILDHYKKMPLYNTLKRVLTFEWYEVRKASFSFVSFNLPSQKFYPQKWFPKSIHSLLKPFAMLTHVWRLPLLALLISHKILDNLLIKLPVGRLRTGLVSLVDAAFYLVRTPVEAAAALFDFLACTIAGIVLLPAMLIITAAATAAGLVILSLLIGSQWLGRQHKSTQYERVAVHDPLEELEEGEEFLNNKTQALSKTAELAIAEGQSDDLRACLPPTYNAILSTTLNHTTDFPASRAVQTQSPLPAATENQEDNDDFGASMQQLFEPVIEAL